MFMESVGQDLPLTHGFSSELHLKKMIEIKDKNIEDLLNQLRQTKEIYQQYKAQYLNEEKSIKAKCLDLTTKYEGKSAQSERLKEQNAKLKAQLESAVLREKKLVQTHQAHLKQLEHALSQSELKNKEIIGERNSLSDKYQSLRQQYGKLQQGQRQKEDEADIYRQQARRLREELLGKQKAWAQQKLMLSEKMRQEQQRKAAKTREKARLNQLQNRIKSTLMKI